VPVRPPAVRRFPQGGGPAVAAHMVTDVANEAIRDRLHQALRDALRARDKIAASALRPALAALDNAGYERAGHDEQARRLRQEAGALTSVPDPATER
jgi:hypothetical protein